MPNPNAPLPQSKSTWDGMKANSCSAMVDTLEHWNIGSDFVTTSCETILYLVKKQGLIVIGKNECLE